MSTLAGVDAQPANNPITAKLSKVFFISSFPFTLKN
uniref:Uncharacterized protein n=1 Tax=mine drainage metagenome TaxID=410659 RepID=E6QQW4_9ZZZZ